MSLKNETCPWFPWVAVLVGICWPLQVAASPSVDLELVLAVDVSGSMSATELRVQRHGYVAALRHPDVAAALTMRGGVAIAYIEWAGPNDQRAIVPWTILTDGRAAEKVAERLAAAPLHPGFHSPPWLTGTSISRALLFAAAMFTQPGSSHIIDISGNGPNSTGGSLAPVREWIVAQGITVNGLAIVKRGGGFPIATYYEDCVIGGQGAFALAVDDPEEFAHTLRRKMVLEIAAIPAQFTLAGFQPAREPRIDCASSETGH